MFFVKCELSNLTVGYMDKDKEITYVLIQSKNTTYKC